MEALVNFVGGVVIGVMAVSLVAMISLDQKMQDIRTCAYAQGARDALSDVQMSWRQGEFLSYRISRDEDDMDRKACRRIGVML